jgi:gamma-glutamyltranspeptidase
MVENSTPVDLLDRLRRVGHRVETMDSAGVMQAVELTSGGEFVGIFDPRVPGQALGF